MSTYLHNQKRFLNPPGTLHPYQSRSFQGMAFVELISSLAEPRATSAGTCDTDVRGVDIRMIPCLRDLSLFDGA